METTVKRATIYLDEVVHKALKLDDELTKWIARRRVTFEMALTIREDRSND